MTLLLASHRKIEKLRVHSYVGNVVILMSVFVFLSMVCWSTPDSASGVCLSFQNLCISETAMSMGIYYIT